MFRFTIRELVLLTVIVAMGVAWWKDRRFSAADRRALAYENRVLTDKCAALKKHNDEGWDLVKKMHSALQGYPDPATLDRP